jgi:mannose-6-phosphate isomerase
MPTDFQQYPLLMEPFFSQRPWGGDRLNLILKKKTPEKGGPWGEAWELSDHPDGRSIITNGPSAGMEFGELMRKHPEQMCGISHKSERYPLLVKYLDAREDLSIQVHPDDSKAPPDDRGKTECWYIMECEPGAEIIHGLKDGTDAALLREAAVRGTLEDCICRVPVRKGDFVYNPAGTVHGLLGGTLICEVQQSSNTTYRLWDWNRQPPRELHIEDSCRVTNYSPPGIREPRLNARDLPPNRIHKLVENEYFRVRLLHAQQRQSVGLNFDNIHGLILNIVEGDGLMNAGKDFTVNLKTGQTWYLPADLQLQKLTAGEFGLRVLVSESLELGKENL